MIYFAVIDIASLNNLTLEELLAKVEKKEISAHDLWCWALRSNKMEVIEFLNSTTPLSVGAIELVSEYGYIDMAKWLYDNRAEYYSGEALANAAGKGYLELVQWLYLNRPVDKSNVWNQDHIRLAIERAAYNGHIDVVKWLYYNARDVLYDQSLQCIKKYNNKDLLAWFYDDVPAR